MLNNFIVSNLLPSHLCQPNAFGISSEGEFIFMLHPSRSSMSLHQAYIYIFKKITDSFATKDLKTIVTMRKLGTGIPHGA